jgi:hypothetical protein
MARAAKQKFKITWKGGVNIREKASLEAEKTGEIIPCGKVVEISSKSKVEEATWGKLADGRGYICLTGLTAKE